MSILNTKITGIRAGLGPHLITEFNTVFGAESATINFTVAMNGGSPVGKPVNLSSEFPTQQVEYAGLNGKFTLEGNCVIFDGSSTWGGQVAVNMDSIVIAIN